MNKYSKLLLTTALLSSLSLPAFAMDPETAKKFEQMMAVIEAQNEKIAALEARLGGQVQPAPVFSNNANPAIEKISALEIQVQQQQVQLNQQAWALESIEPAAGDSGDDVKIKMRGASPEVDFGNGTKFNLHGRIQTDFAAFDEGGSTVDIADQADIRRLFVGTRGTIDYDWAYSFFADFANGPGGERPNIQDAWLAYNGFDNLSLKVGNQIELFSLEQHVSNLNQSFIERSIVHDAFHPVRTIGATAKYSGENWTLAGGVFGDSPNDTADTDDQEHALGTRLTYAPILDGDHYLHLGGAARYASPGGTDTFTYNSRPGTRLSDGVFGANTGAIADVDDTMTYAAEVAYNIGPVALQAEYMTVDVERDEANLNALDFDGWYAHASWFLTGENRKYVAKKGSLGRVKPKAPLTEGGWGAWELAARYATVDLTDADVTGGELDTTNFAINWYPHNNVRFDLNYVHNEGDANSPIGIMM